MGFTGPISNDYRFGVSVAELGDFDGDGIRDLLVGSHRANIGGVERGGVWILLMNANGTVRDHRQISALAGDLPGPLDDGDRFGISCCSLGDLDLDGTTDIAVGTYRDDDGGVDHGAVYILFLTPDGTVKRQQKISSLEGGFTGTLRMEDSFGWSVENIGDLDDDGVTDLAVGATRDDGGDPDPTLDYGALYVLYMRADGTVKSHAKIGFETPGFGSVLRPRDRFGADVALLDDADGDGVEDIAVGAFGEDPLKYGRVFVMHLRPDFSVKDYTEIGHNVGGFTGLLGKGDRFGISLAAHDLDGDGVHDLVIGAAGDDDGGADAGAVWVCMLNAQGSVKSFEKISPDFGGFGGLLHPGDYFGISCATIGDLDRDGAVDLAVGAYQDDTNGLDRGAAWVLFRAGTGVPVADFVSHPTAGEPPLTVTFEDRSSGPVTGWTWNFDDGTSSNERSPAHVFTKPGVYDVTQWVKGPRGTDSLLRQRAVVGRTPAAPRRFHGRARRRDRAAHGGLLRPLGGRDLLWSWDFGDGDLEHPQSQALLPPTSALHGRPDGARQVREDGAPDLRRKVVPTSCRRSGRRGARLRAGRARRSLTVSFTDPRRPTSRAGSGPSATYDLVRPLARCTYATPGHYDVALTVRGPSGSGRGEPSRADRGAQPLVAAFDFVAGRRHRARGRSGSTITRRRRRELALGLPATAPPPPRQNPLTPSSPAAPSRSS